MAETGRFRTQTEYVASGTSGDRSRTAKRDLQPSGAIVLASSNAFAEGVSREDHVRAVRDLPPRRARVIAGRSNGT